MAAKNTRYFILLLSTLFLFSCTQGENAENSNNEQAIEKPLTAEAKEAKALVKNKNLINKFYNDIGFEIFDLILKDRVYEKKPESRTKLKGMPLDSFPKYLSGEKENNTREYVIRFLQFKSEAISPNNNSELITKFRNARVSLLTSTFYTDTILKGQEDDKQYDDLETSVSRIFDETLEEVENNKIDYLKVESSKNVQQQELKTTREKQEVDVEQKAEFSSSTVFKEYSWWFFGLFLISLILNLLQFFKYKKTKKHHKNALSKANYEKQEVPHSHSSFQPKATKLRNSEVKNTIEQVYVKFQESLINQYHKDCLAQVSIKFDNLRTDTLLEASSSSFYDKIELQQFIDKKISQDGSTLSYELKDYVAKNDAKLEIDNRIIAQNFVQAINTNIVQEEDIANKVRQLKQIAVSELPDVTNTTALNSTINTLEKDIKMVLQKMVQDNSVFYFAFADTNGTLQDAKKTKTIERDSAIQLSINPDDITKATFRLLLEKDDMMQAGIMSYDSFLIPICELTSDNFNSTGTTIEQIGPDGTMVLENGIWKVKNKLPIKVI